MQSKLSEDQFDKIVQLSYPSFLLKTSHICLDTCAIDLTKEEESAEGDKSLMKLQPRAKGPEELLYLSDREALCIEACSRLYVRSTHSIVESFKKKLTF